MIRRLHDERGVTAIIVAISLVAIFAMLTLTVDVGGLLYKRRELVNGSDAAALAAAQSCAILTDSDNPETVADRYATDNVNGLTGVNATTNITQSPGCDSRASGHVTVQYSMAQQLYFAEVLGFGKTSLVSAVSTAAWGPLASGYPVPIVLDSGQLQGSCNLPSPGVPIGTECSFWYNNSTGSIRNLDPLLGTSSWGYMNLGQWGVPGNANCSNAGSSQRGSWIDGSAQARRR